MSKRFSVKRKPATYVVAYPFLHPIQAIPQYRSDSETIFYFGVGHRALQVAQIGGFQYVKLSSINTNQLHETHFEFVPSTPLPVNRVFFLRGLAESALSCTVLDPRYPTSSLLLFMQGVDDIVERP